MSPELSDAARSAFVRLSVVIPNFNYGRFLREAVSSALNLEWADVEVIVVDDGSTDDSLQVLIPFADRVRVISQANAGQRVACNVGFAASTGDAIIFLDSDDLLEPSLAIEVSRVWTSRVSKAQVQVQRVNASNQPVGVPTPHFKPVPRPTDITYWTRRTTAYPTPPGSGNVYSRWFLDEVMPMPPQTGDAADSILLALAPFLGDVVSVPRPVVRYRRHGENDSNLFVDSMRFSREVARAESRYAYAMNFLNRPFSKRTLRRSRQLLQFRIADQRTQRRPLRKYVRNLRSLIIDTLCSPVHPGPEPVWFRLVVMLWSVAVLVGPRVLAHRLILSRYTR